VNSIQNTNKLFRRDFHISPGCLLHNFKELSLSTISAQLAEHVDALLCLRTGEFILLLGRQI